MRIVNFVMGTILAAFGGAATGFCMIFPGMLVGGFATVVLGTRGPDGEALLFTSGFSMMGGFLIGPLGFLSGTWVRGLLVGLIVASLSWGLLFMNVSSPYPPIDVMVWTMVVSVVAGGAAGVVGGGLRQLKFVAIHG